jgi:hypothetical protein
MDNSDRLAAIPSNSDQPQLNKFFYCSLPRACGQFGYFHRQYDLSAHLFALECLKQDRMSQFICTYAFGTSQRFNPSQAKSYPPRFETLASLLHKLRLFRYLHVHNL